MNLWDFLVYIVIFGVIAFTDWRYHKIFNWTLLSGLGFSLFVAIYDGHIINSLISAVVGFCLLLGSWKFSKGQVGMGDIKLGFLIGLVVGFPLVFWTIAGAMIAGGLAAYAIVKLKVRITNLPVGVTMSIFALGILATTIGG